MNARLLLPLLLAAGCAAAKSVPHASMPSIARVSSSAPAPAPVAPTPTPAPAQQATGTTQAQPAKGGEQAPAVDSAVIYTGDVAMLEDADRMAPLIDAIIDLAEKHGGRLQGRRDDGVAIRVPATRFRQAMSDIDRLGMVTHRSVKAEDVTEELHDGEVRLENLRATRKRLQDFLAKANDIPNTLVVERELERVSVEIDRIEGRIRYLQAHAALSTIDVKIAVRPPPVIAAVPPPVQAAPAPRPRGLLLPIKWLDKLDAHHLSSF